jgi:hypothetical protein
VRATTRTRTAATIATSGAHSDLLAEIGGKALRPAVAIAVVDGVLEAMRPGAGDGDRLRDELRRVEREIGRLADAIATGGPLSSLAKALLMEWSILSGK